MRDGAGAEVALGDLRLGDVVRVRPGESVASDGTIVSGSSYLDESMVTGEPVPVARREGAAVIGGTLNTTGSFDFRVTGVGADTLLARIVRTVEGRAGREAADPGSARPRHWLVRAGRDGSRGCDLPRLAGARSPPRRCPLQS